MLVLKEMVLVLVLESFVAIEHEHEHRHPTEHEHEITDKSDKTGPEMWVKMRLEA